jgi:hypothetical protein
MKAFLDSHPLLEALAGPIIGLAIEAVVIAACLVGVIGGPA